jgi:hypothetical protein
MFGSYMDNVIHLWIEIKDDTSPSFPFSLRGVAAEDFPSLRQGFHDHGDITGWILKTTNTQEYFKNGTVSRHGP